MSKINTSKHIICYIDLLGTKDRIAKDSNSDYLNVINDSYNEAIKIVNAISYLATELSYRIKIFSDNIIIASESDINRKDDNHIAIALNRMTLIAMAIQRELLKQDIFILGGITWGELYIDETFVYGKGLLDSYKLECEKALYPRIIIDDELIKLSEYCLQENEDNVLQLYNIKKDKDKLYFLDYLNYIKDEKVSSIIDHSNKKIDSLIEIEADNRVVQKLIWHKQYLEYLLDKRNSIK